MSVLMLDDFQDNALMRYGKPTWHSLPHIGKNVAFHAVFTESCVFFLMQKYFSKHPQYTKILESFFMCIFYLKYSQLLDIIPFNENNLNQDYLQASYFGKGEETTFRTAFSIAMHLAGIDNPEIHHKMKNVISKLGRWLQMQVSEK